MDNNIPWSILSKHFQNVAEDHDKDRLRQWLEEDEANPLLLDELHVLHNLSCSFDRELLPDKDKAWKKINQRIEVSPKVDYRFMPKLKFAAAAVGFLLLGIALHWLFGQIALDRGMSGTYTEIVVPSGHKVNATLPDGTKVWMNSGTILKYNGKYNRNRRDIELIGEAYFDVNHDASKPFSVTSGQLKVNVTGTSFNIKSQLNDHLQEITVEHGTVDLYFRGEEIGKMRANQQVILDKSTGYLSSKSAQIDLALAWKKNELVFDNTPIDEVVKYLERWYGVNITVDEALMQNRRYTFKVKTESLREMMELMKKITPLTYEVDGKNVTINYLNQK